MCKKTTSGRIDRCIRKLIGALHQHPQFIPIGSCCGHGRYTLSIVVRDRNNGKVFELLSGVTIPRKRNIYRKDKDGYYYIPEVVEYNDLIKAVYKEA